MIPSKEKKYKRLKSSFHLQFFSSGRRERRSVRFNGTCERGTFRKREGTHLNGMIWQVSCAGRAAVEERERERAMAVIMFEAGCWETVAHTWVALKISQSASAVTAAR